MARTLCRCPSSNMRQRPVRRSHTLPHESSPLQRDGIGVVSWERKRPTRSQPESHRGGNRQSRRVWSDLLGGGPPYGTPGPTVSRSGQTCRDPGHRQRRKRGRHTHEAAARNLPDGWKAIREMRWAWPSSSPIGVSLGRNELKQLEGVCVCVCTSGGPRERWSRLLHRRRG